MINIPKDMITGTRHKTRSNGTLEILSYDHNSDVQVRFINTGYVCTTYASQIRNGYVSDKLAKKPIKAVKVPTDMVAGTQHKTNSCGFLEVVKYKNATTVEVRFIATGHECTTQSVSIRNGAVADNSVFKRLGRPKTVTEPVIVPEDMKQGTQHETKNGGMVEVVYYKDVKTVTVKFLDTGEFRTCHACTIRGGFDSSGMKMPKW